MAQRKTIILTTPEPAYSYRAAGLGHLRTVLLSCLGRGGGGGGGGWGRGKGGGFWLGVWVRRAFGFSDLGFRGLGEGLRGLGGGGGGFGLKASKGLGKRPYNPWEALNSTNILTLPFLKEETPGLPYTPGSFSLNPRSLLWPDARAWNSSLPWPPVGAMHWACKVFGVWGLAFGA